MPLKLRKYRDNNKHREETMTKAQAERLFKNEWRPDWNHDKPMKRQAWNNYVDWLQKSGEITERQAATWTQPHYISN